ncbi:MULTISPECIES: TrkH family potassium uptake protein [unclassified Oceanispirochaeta]|uniref:TrkH family potassium uptake protein n=1 Tax=unclassified Oceanispirochaeta TaxID=2635722 RepID=UPI000E091B06|nr:MULTISPECIES: TrkH family potassium uptake protein [unclassified Oceanispirochaeta]MBF9016754.1 TrkH family potassium uptake protein [Oceanispirochaeta sp. M2]NPD72024.1 TrkH family potassium uptake protein [Oceanispirochaeta sp. M1]RDG32468.1 TrkH family potassium uptake protein [Oceanispirochaeta sp. M1]
MRKIFLIFFVILGIIGLFLEQYRNIPGILNWFVTIIDYSLVSYLLLDFFWGMKSSSKPSYYIKKNLFSFLFIIIYLSLFIINLLLKQRSDLLTRDNNLMTIIRNILLVLKIFGRFRKVSTFLQSIITKPAQTVVFSFIMVILIGSLILMMPVMSTGVSLTPLNALFTVTSAVCVTGLTVIDTANQFTPIGKIVILLLIQIGGLGIMLLSFFMVFLFKQRLSVKDKNLLSYMLSSKNTQSLKRSVLRIIFLTFLIEITGALLLFPIFSKSGLPFARAVFFSIFHSVSAFCNAGFALYSDSLVSFNKNLMMNIIITTLIIAGGISFAVILDIHSLFFNWFKKKKAPLSINSKIVLIVSSILTVSGTLIIYKLEHISNLYPAPLWNQYLSAYFQSVTLRTAGFNTIPFEKLSNGTLLIMMGLMFIGGASGSTAGGIKVNTLGVVWAYIRSFRRGEQEILLYRQQIPKDNILQAFTVIAFAVLSIFIVSSVLVITEDAPPIKILFETVSAFATVGLTAGITGSLSPIGKIGIIFLMFLGRLGPLTLLTASSGKEKQSRISYPEASIMIG